uniref:protein-serine/threonine phosphatase n=1 Tax=Leersia perrieri TaxID=77586 RepID=A0A0D9WBZ2_9ORYZ
MGNRVARLATPCFADAVTVDGVDDGAAVPVAHILSFVDGRETPAFTGAIHGVLLPSNQSTAGGAVGGASVLNDGAMSVGSSSFDSSNSFSFRTLQPMQYSGQLEYSATSPSTSGASTTSSSLRQPRRTDKQILDELAAAKSRRRRRCQESPLLRLRNAVASLLRAAPCVFPEKSNRNDPSAATNGGEERQNGGAGGEEAAAERVQWARGKAGEDRVHVVVSEEHGWMFVGIYDGFNGPDATDYLADNLYAAVCRELAADELINQNQQHREVLDAMARALRRTEEGYFAEAEARAADWPEMGMMGSCVLVVLIKGADVYAMNVGDSRAVLAHQAQPDLVLPRNGGGDGGDLAGVKEAIKRQYDACEMGELAALQLTMDHSTNVYKEVRRIRSEHLDDPACITNDRVKGSLKVTRAFGAGYLKEPRWNNALLEVFQVDYVGTLPYITCRPYIRHHRLGPQDKFLILSSDGLYEYFTNEEVVAQVEAFTARYPDEDPAKYLSHQILLRAAHQAGMGFHELLEIQQGDRRQYHDDVSIIIISLDGKIWRSSE